MDLHINMKEIKVNEVAASSGIFSGENYHAHWSAMSKTNTGLELSGEANLSRDCFNLVYDSDDVSMFKAPGELLKNGKKQVKNE